MLHGTLVHDNTYNTTIAKKLKEGNKQLIDHQEENNSMGDTSFASHLEGMALRGDTVAGGSGYVAAAVRGMGFPEDKTGGAKGAEPRGEEEAETAQGHGGGRGNPGAGGDRERPSGRPVSAGSSGP